VEGEVGTPENLPAIGAICPANGRADGTALNLTLKTGEIPCRMQLGIPPTLVVGNVKYRGQIYYVLKFRFN